MKEDTAQTIELNVEGMTCTNCALGISHYLNKQGLEEVSVDFASAEARFKLQEKTGYQKLLKG